MFSKIINKMVFILLLLLSSAFGEDTTNKPESKNRMPRGKRQLIYVPFVPSSNFYAPPTAPSIITPKMIIQSKMYFPQSGFTNAPNGQNTLPSQFHGHNLPVAAAFSMVPNLSIEGLGNILLGHGPNIHSNAVGNMMGIKVLNSGQASGIIVTTGHSLNNGQAIGQVGGTVPFMNSPASYTNSQPLSGGQDLSGHVLNGQLLGNQAVDGHSLNHQAYNGLGGRSYDGHFAVTGSQPYGVISHIMHATPYMK